jgi:hypothetical protein
VGVVVGKDVSARKSTGLEPTAHTIFVPPVSMPPYNINVASFYLAPID